MPWLKILLLMRFPRRGRHIFAAPMIILSCRQYLYFMRLLELTSMAILISWRHRRLIAHSCPSARGFIGKQCLRLILARMKHFVDVGDDDEPRSRDDTYRQVLMRAT